MNKLEYKKYLNSSHWKQIRYQIYRKHPLCKFCYRKNWLNIHHKTYVRLGNERLNDLVVLCKFCHHALHAEKPEEGVITIREWLAGKRKKVVNTNPFNQFAKEYKKAMKHRDFEPLMKLKSQVVVEDLDFGQKKHFKAMCKKTAKYDKTQQKKYIIKHWKLSSGKRISEMLLRYWNVKDPTQISLTKEIFKI